MRGYVAMAGGGLLAVAALLAASWALTHFGIAPWGVTDPQALSTLVMTRGIKVVVIVFAALVVIRTASAAIAATHRVGADSARGDAEWQRRAKTLAEILTRLVSAVVWFVAVLMLLRELSIDVLPILTGAGIAGLAIGFGAQNLVRDVISGFFLILEDQVRVGDAARVNTVSGVIEHVNLRTLVVRDEEGAVHVFPNGTVTALANISKQFSYATVDVRVRLAQDVEVVFEVLRDVGTQLQHDPAWASSILEPLDISGVTAWTDRDAVIRARFKTRPLQHGRVAGELRRRLAPVLAERGVKPFARRPVPR